MEFWKDGYLISTNKEKLDVGYIHGYLSNESYWAQGIPIEIVEKTINGSLCFGIYTENRQVGFARVITDAATFAYLADVFVDEQHRGKGLSKWLMDIIMNHDDLQSLRRFMLATRDAHSLYEQYGFSPLTFTERWMHIHYPDRYKT